MTEERMNRTAIALALLLLSAFVAAPTAAAKDEVVVEVTSICASTQPSGRAADADVDPRLAGFAKKLRSLFAYNRYAFLGRS